MASGLVRIGERRGQRGMTTAEYAVGTVATVTIVGVLITILNNEEFRKMLGTIMAELIKMIIRAITGS